MFDSDPVYQLPLVSHKLFLPNLLIVLIFEKLLRNCARVPYSLPNLCSRRGKELQMLQEEF
ncbi:hypothetical protein I3760_08G097200 [Carya illinoinensis]|nr:hypothetical protein I3760_08G097200 [Carya illinoinensis]